MNIYIARHGEDEDNAKSLFNGRRNQSLTDKGREQAFELGVYLESLAVPFDVMYTSPMDRAMDTAAIIRGVIPSEELKLVVEDGIKERDIGAFSGLTVAESLARYTGETVTVGERIYILNPDDGESMQELENRAQRFLDLLREKKYENVLCVSHGTFIKILIKRYLGITLEEALTQGQIKNGEMMLLSNGIAIKIYSTN